jgi:hypothetical protein
MGSLAFVDDNPTSRELPLICKQEHESAQAVMSSFHPSEGKTQHMPHMQEPALVHRKREGR